MAFCKSRVIEPERLDDETPERAAPSLRDLVRINRLLGGHRVLREAIRQIVPPSQAFTMLDVGAASGDAAATISALYPKARVTSLDYRSHHMAAAKGTRVSANAFQLPFRPASFDFVYCGLFLHHFSSDAVISLLRSFGAVARLQVIANDLERHLLPYHFIPSTTWLFGWDPITQHDAPASVQAGFSQAELAELARSAGLREVRVDVYRPAFRLCLTAKPAAS
ncbi:MAG: methyltransferase domain-containing protein [Bryobacteraceae bacterium]|nr:methyltransferase domain-containing protein [Bryobacteraceae bacterium]